MTREEKEQWDIFMRIWVIPALKNTWGEKKCKEIVEALEEWEEQEPWIPVSERLPEKNVEVLATTENGYVTIAEWLEYDHWFIHEGSTNAHTDELTAWMPLPKSYKAESEE